VGERRAAEGLHERREVPRVLVRLGEHPPLDRVVGEGGDDRGHGPLALILGDPPHDTRRLWDLSA
jgi:hypothetical protein